MIRSLSFIIIFIIYFLPNISYAKVDSIFETWHVGQDIDEFGYKICYIFAIPINYNRNNYLITGKIPYFMISYFLYDNRFEVSFHSKNEIKLNSDIFFLIDNEIIKLYSYGNYGWLDTDLKDKKLISKIISFSMNEKISMNNKLFKIRSNSSYGEYNIDIFSLNAFISAYYRLNQLCTDE